MTTLEGIPYVKIKTLLICLSAYYIKYYRIPAEGNMTTSEPNHVIRNQPSFQSCKATLLNSWGSKGYYYCLKHLKCGSERMKLPGCSLAMVSCFEGENKAMCTE